MSRFIYISLLLFVFLTVFCKYSNGDLTLYVDPSSKSTDTSCGQTTANACNNFIDAYSSYLKQTDGTNSTALNMVLMDGVYNATDNAVMGDIIYIHTLNIYSYSQDSSKCVLSGSNIKYLYFNYQSYNAAQSQSLVISNVTISHSNFFVVVGGSPVSVTFSNCVFNDTQTTTFSLFNLVSPLDAVSTPTFTLEQCNFNQVNFTQSTLLEITNYNVVVNMTTIQGFIGDYAFKLINCSANFDDLTISGSSARYNLLETMNTNLTITSGNFNNNYGGWASVLKADQISSLYAHIVIQLSHFVNNTTPLNGAIYLLPANGQNHIFSTYFYNNSATNNGNGGAIYVGNSNTDIEDCYFELNSAVRGGAIAVYSSKSVTISDCKFISNSANVGAAIDSTNSGLTISSNTFTNNIASANGNDLSCSYSTVVLTNDTNINNSDFSCPQDDCTFTDTPSNFKCSNGDSSSTTHSSSHHNNSPKTDYKKLLLSILLPIFAAIILIIIIVIVVRRQRNKHSYHVYAHHEKSSLLNHNQY